MPHYCSTCTTIRATNTSCHLHWTGKWSKWFVTLVTGSPKPIRRQRQRHSSNVKTTSCSKHDFLKDLSLIVLASGKNFAFLVVGSNPSWSATQQFNVVTSNTALSLEIPSLSTAMQIHDLWAACGNPKTLLLRKRIHLKKTDKNQQLMILFGE